MKSEKTNGAKVSRFDVRADYARIESERLAKQPPLNPEFVGGRYVVAVGQELPPEQMLIYIGENGEETKDVQDAIAFDTYGDALKWAADNCDFSQIDYSNVPRGFERPRYPRVCYLRIYTELTEC